MGNRKRLEEVLHCAEKTTAGSRGIRKCVAVATLGEGESPTDQRPDGPSLGWVDGPSLGWVDGPSLSWVDGPTSDWVDGPPDWGVDLRGENLTV